MLKRLTTCLALAAAQVSPRAAIVKVKINGRCVNRCSFCMFHSDSSRLEAADLARLFGLIDKPRFRRVDINGGEPSLHPRFDEIAGFLRQHFAGGVVLHLGTNLIPLAAATRRARRMLQAALASFDMLSVGCDDEHANVHCLEQLAGEIVASGRLLCVNVMADYCSPETRRRILAVRERVGIRVTFSRVHHFCDDGVGQRVQAAPCRHRTRELLVNCNGDGFFCFHQELTEPLFNLHTVDRERLNWLLEEYEPAPYRFCGSCPCYAPRLGDLLRRRLRRGRRSEAVAPVAGV